MISEPACKSQVQLPKLRQISAPCDLASRDTSTLRLRIAWSQTGRHDSTGRFIPEFTHQHGIGQKQLVLLLASVKKLLQI